MSSASFGSLLQAKIALPDHTGQLLRKQEAGWQPLTDHLPPEQVATVVHVLLGPVSRAPANAPPEDEEISAEEEQAVAEAREWLKHNPRIGSSRR